MDLAVIVDFDGLAFDELRFRYALPRRVAQKTPRLECVIVSSVVLWGFFLEITRRGQNDDVRGVSKG